MADFLHAANRFEWSISLFLQISSRNIAVNMKAYNPILAVGEIDRR